MKQIVFLAIQNIDPLYCRPNILHYLGVLLPLYIHKYIYISPGHTQVTHTQTPTHTHTHPHTHTHASVFFTSGSGSGRRKRKLISNIAKAHVSLSINLKGAFYSMAAMYVRPLFCFRPLNTLLKILLLVFSSLPR